MPTPLPARPDLSWLRKRAKDTLKTLRGSRTDARLAEAQLFVAREHGFPSWRSLKAHVDHLRSAAIPAQSLAEELVASFLRRVGVGDRAAVAAALGDRPSLVNAVGPHPFWGGRPQPLHVAIETRRRSMFSLLLKAGADVNGSNDQYQFWSPLLLAVHGGQTAMQRELLRRRARVGLVEALALGNDRATLRLLATGRKALPSRVPSHGSLLAFARTPRAIDRLLALGVPPEQPDHWGTTPVEALSRLGREGRVLVRHLHGHGVIAGSQVQARLGDLRALTGAVRQDPSIARRPDVLHAAVEGRHHRLVAWLLDRGADPNARMEDSSYRTPLHSAAWAGDLRMTRLLLERGADRNLRDREHNSTPREWAETAIEVRNNPHCRDVLAMLAATQ